MIDQQTPYRIVATSLSKPGDLILEDSAGGQWLFIGSTGTVSQGQLHSEFVDALLRRQQWETVSDDTWHSLDDLRARFMDAQGDGYRSQARRLVGRLSWSSNS